MTGCIGPLSTHETTRNKLTLTTGKRKAEERKKEGRMPKRTREKVRENESQVKEKEYGN